MQRKTSNHDRNEALVASTRRIYDQYASGLITTEELVRAVKEIANSSQSFVYAVGQDKGDDLTYGTIQILTPDTDPALMITARCGDEIRIDKSCILTFKNAVLKAVKVLEEKYPIVGQL